MLDTAHFDTLIIGAGLSGIGIAVRLQKEYPQRSMNIIERRERMGGTWDLFRYPGIRSDSDMASFGYGFKPWNSEKVLADGPSIRDYIKETAEEFDIIDKIQYSLKVIEADWSSGKQLWHLATEDVQSGQTKQFTCKFLLNCCGYFNYDEGHRPHFKGEETYKGKIVHPQHWPQDMDYSGKRVAVIGSGATAVTIVPAMAATAEHVTMVQRSPSYVFSVPNNDKIAEGLRKIMPNSWAFNIIRKRNLIVQRALYNSCRKWPKTMRKFLMNQVKKEVGPEFDMSHFTPKYMPWDERLCAVPDSNLFVALREQRASVVTDDIETFTEDGILMKSGQEIATDIIVTATGLQLQMMGGIELKVDSVPTPLNEQLTYKASLIENVPNFMWVFGYTNAPWTLKSEIASQYLCRLFEYMDKHEYAVVTPRDMEDNALDDGIMDSLNSGYVQRNKHHLPRQGKASPWNVMMNYKKDKKMLLSQPIEDDRLEFLPRIATPSSVAI